MPFGGKARAGQVEVKDDHCFVGFDAYEKLIGSGVAAAQKVLMEMYGGAA